MKKFIFSTLFFCLFVSGCASTKAILFNYNNTNNENNSIVKNVQAFYDKTKKIHEINVNISGRFLDDNNKAVANKQIRVTIEMFGIDRKLAGSYAENVISDRDGYFQKNIYFISPYTRQKINIKSMRIALLLVDDYLFDRMNKQIMQGQKLTIHNPAVITYFLEGNKIKKIEEKFIVMKQSNELNKDYLISYNETSTISDSIVLKTIELYSEKNENFKKEERKQVAELGQKIKNGEDLSNYSKNDIRNAFGAAGLNFTAPMPGYVNGAYFFLKNVDIDRNVCFPAEVHAILPNKGVLVGAGSLRVYVDFSNTAYEKDGWLIYIYGKITGTYNYKGMLIPKVHAYLIYNSSEFNTAINGIDMTESDLILRYAR